MGSRRCRAWQASGEEKSVAAQCIPIVVMNVEMGRNQFPIVARSRFIDGFIVSLRGLEFAAQLGSSFIDLSIGVDRCRWAVPANS